MSIRRYSKISRRIWNDARFRSLSAPEPNGRDLFIRLLTGPELTNIPGLVPCGEAAMAEALGWSVEGFREAFREVFREGLAEGDWEARLVWVPNAIKHNEPESPNVVASWAVAWDEAPECDLKCTAWEALRAHMKARGSKWLEAFDKACPKPFAKPSAKAFGKALANQEQEQEQEQEERETREASQAPLAAPPLPGQGEEPSKPKRSSPRSSQARDAARQALQGEIAALSVGLPVSLLSRAREGLTEASASGRYSDTAWRNALRDMRAAAERHGDHASQAIVDSLQTYVDRYAGERPIAYLAGIVRGWEGAQQQARPSSHSRGGMRPCSPDSEFQPEGDSDEYLDQIFGPEVARA